MTVRESAVAVDADASADRPPDAVDPTGPTATTDDPTVDGPSGTEPRATPTDRSAGTSTTDSTAGPDSAEGPVSEPGPEAAALDEAYRSACARYTRAVRGAQQSRTTAERRYRDEVDGVRAVAQRAVAERESAARAAADATRLVAQTDDAATELWRRLGTYVGDKRLGPTPPPAEEVSATGPAAVTGALKRTRAALATVQRGELPFGPPRHAVGIAAAIGAGCGLLAAAVALLLLGVDGDENARAVSQAAGLVVLFLGSIAGIPVVGGWLSVRHRVGLGAGHIAAAVGAAVVTVAALSPLLLAA